MICPIALLVVALVGAHGAAVPDSHRIVGGQLANDEQFPHQVALFYNGVFRCGGSIIHKRFILTAAHCVVQEGVLLDATQMTLHTGSANMNNGGRLYSAKHAYPHEEYAMFEDDIAVIELTEDIVYDDFTQPIELLEEELSVGSEVIISGYGRVSPNGPVSEQLLYNRMYLSDHEACQEFGSGLLCLNSEAGNGACNGDSGGPATYDGKLAGVANFILNYCGGELPDGYAKVAHYVDWIRKFLQ